MGPNSLRGTAIFGGNYDIANSTSPGYAKFFMTGNIDGRRRSTSYDERLFFDPADWSYLSSSVIGALSVQRYTSAEQGVRDVLASGGALPRDASDQRVVADFLACRGKIIDDPSQVGGWPTLASGMAYGDADGDGMSDTWESARKWTDPNADGDGDGYTNLEEFLNELAGDQDASGNLINRVGAGQGAVPPVNCGIAVA